jgi:hypothetical protein
MNLKVLEQPNGIVIYKGPSSIDQEPIVCIAVGIRQKSHNSKTGDLIQTYILRADQHPIEAVYETGDDESICGSCKHRGKSCYVNVAQGPTAIYKAFLRGKYPTISYGKAGPYFANRKVRLGAYGDPMAVPFEIWKSILVKATSHTGYTHQWNEPWCDMRFREICMASCDTKEELENALAAGWTPFYVRSPTESLPEKSFECPASSEQDKRLTCEECMACHGGIHNGKKAFPSIIVHGSPVRTGQFAKYVKV